MKYFSTFTGVGGFELGIRQAHPDWECVGVSEIDKYCNKLLEDKFKVRNYGDITKIDAERLPDFDLFCGGFPCQSFSIAGKRRGFEDTRGTAGGQGAKTGAYAVPVLTPDRLEKRQNGRRFKESGDPMFTLNTQDKHGVLSGSVIRRLTPLECERLQGFPDGWTAKFSDTQRYKMCGNAVTVNVIAALMRRIQDE